MPDSDASASAGFSRSSLRFLSQLRSHNDRPWFDAHRSDYEAHLLQPFQRLAAALAPYMEEIDPYLEVRPAVGKTISRIYRDTRFSSDKAPFRSSMWITFKRPSMQWADRPAYFFELDVASYRFGMGFYSARPATMDQLRDRIRRSPTEFLEAAAFYPGQSTFALEGDCYRRSIPNDLPAEIQPWYQRKSWHLASRHEVDDLLFSGQLIQELIDGYVMLAPLYRYLVRKT